MAYVFNKLDEGTYRIDNMQKDAVRYWTVELQRLGSKCEHTSLTLVLSNFAFNLIKWDRLDKHILSYFDIWRLQVAGKKISVYSFGAPGYDVNISYICNHCKQYFYITFHVNLVCMWRTLIQ